MTVVLIRRQPYRHGDTWRNTCEDGGRSWSGIYKTRSATNCWQLPKIKARKDYSLVPLGKI